MIQSYEKNRGVPPGPFSLAQEILRLVYLAAALGVFLALASYSPHDTSWSTWSTTHEVQNWIGPLGSSLADALYQILGFGAWATIVILLREAWTRTPRALSLRKTVEGLAFLIALSYFLESALPTSLGSSYRIHAGGALGKLAQNTLAPWLSPKGSFLLSLFALLISFILFFERSVTALAEKAWCVTKAAFVKLKALAPQKKIPVVTVAEPGPVRESTWTPAEKENPEVVSVDYVPPASPPTKGLFSSWKEKKVKKAVSKEGYALPDLALLTRPQDSKNKSVDKGWFLEKGEILVQKLNDFGVEGEIVHISPGPVITVYEFKPASGVKIKDIANLSDDLTLALSVLSVRIVAPIPGKPVVGIEIPSPVRETVHFRDLIEETKFFDEKTKIPIALGRLASGEPVLADLAAMPHLLVAGSTGTGKSVFINTLISSLLFRYSPRELKLILVDPKMVELSTYEGVPHLLLPVVVDSKKAAMALRWAVDEMERRYTLLHKTGVRHIDAFNEKMKETPPPEGEISFLPFIVIVIDEYADLMAVVPKDVELSITRLAQKARASGIHLVLATQRPSTDVVTGTIKANFPSRISFRVASSVDSKTILDRTGADRLLGSGDLLFHSAGFTTLKRIQGAFLSDKDLNRVVEYLKTQGEPEYDEHLLAAQENPEEYLEGAGSGSSDDKGDDPGLYDRAVRLVAEKGEASISLLQRHFKIGYNRAATLIEKMEQEGVVGQATGAAKRRPVLVSQL